MRTFNTLIYLTGDLCLRNAFSLGGAPGGASACVRNELLTQCVFIL